MTPSFQTQAQIRFGFGLSPRSRVPDSVDDMMTRLAGPDDIAGRFPIKSFAFRAEKEAEMRTLRRAKRKNEAGAEAAYKVVFKAARAELGRELRVSMIRPLVSQDGFRERLVRFWADHFSVAARSTGLRFVTTAYVEDAIRPNTTGTFRQLLREAAIHPVMLVYLDQILSFGPNSKTGKKLGRGLNENLAREILELHTLGVGGGYTQTDVREFAELLTGLFYNFKKGFQFRKQTAEPGAETVLGKSYGGKRARLEDVLAALDDLATHPDTARHIARKLVVHFVSDTPDEKLVAHVAQAFQSSDGDLMAVYTALLEHPAAWDGFGHKAKQPFDFLISSLRAMDADAGKIEAMGGKDTRLYLSSPMQVMGQPWQVPKGPDGWPEPLEDWITPQGLAARIQWALMAAGMWGRNVGPKTFVRTALGEMADTQLIETVGFAESRLEGIALTLASPEFNRR